MRSLLGYLVFVLVFLVGISAQAQGSWMLYDDFNSEFIDVERWTTSQRIDTGVTILEYVRELHGGRLHMVDRAFGNTSGPYSGSRAGDISSAFGMGKVYKSLKVSIKPKEVEVTGCSSNSTASSSRARLLGFFFNTAGSPYNGRINDVLAQIIIRRNSDSTDKPQLLEVRAEVYRCSNSDCTQATGESVPLGNIWLGQWANVEIEWDKDNYQFNFMLNGMPSSIRYPENWHVYQVSSPYNALGLCNRIANCPTTERGMGYIYAEFDNLYVKELP